ELAVDGCSLEWYSGEATGCSAAWLARHTGGVEVAGSDPASAATGGLLEQASLLSYFARSRPKSERARGRPGRPEGRRPSGVGPWALGSSGPSRFPSCTLAGPPAACRPGVKAQGFGPGFLDPLPVGLAQGPVEAPEPGQAEAVLRGQVPHHLQGGQGQLAAQA